MQLGVNIDHVATLRQARYAGSLEAPNCEPDLLLAASACEHAGAAGITIHLRADRRHIQDRDVSRLRASILTRLNLEMGNTSEIVDIALLIVPEEVCLVPENRLEVTTEGGLDAALQRENLAPTVRRLQAGGIRVSLFIEPDEKQIDAARVLGVEMVEFHTGAFANAQGAAQSEQLQRLHGAAVMAHSAGLQVNAGHGLNYDNVLHMHSIPHLVDLNIGHSIISRALLLGLPGAVAEMVALIATAPEGNVRSK